MYSVTLTPTHGQCLRENITKANHMVRFRPRTATSTIPYRGLVEAATLQKRITIKKALAQPANRQSLGAVNGVGHRYDYNYLTTNRPAVRYLYFGRPSLVSPWT
ncbi:hypothetical protein EVAR_11245_1 [Eumeta japonica]|uniref:Uncharacterized protein n=1 Tax=Eumeta variegata TaxID=151549 RepID=A0A4C1UM09_EUMVA|nr:hypothetical protein EVAR_11245_1 [Eumeta japonica]